ncbi:MAG: HD domain-containing protein [Anaerolineales bacterium]
MKIAYRASQFLNALFARLTPEDHLLIEKTLPPSLLEVFRRMGRSDQLHGVRVLRSVRAGGTDHPTLCAAALLHDVGKSRHHPRLWDRILVVLATALFPEAVERWGNAGEPRGLRRPFIIAAQHPRWGADIVRAAGGSDELVALVRRHQAIPPLPPQTQIDRLLLRLQQADGEN